MTGHSVKVYILFTNVRDINYANIIFNPNLLSPHKSVELSPYYIKVVIIIVYTILYFLNKSYSTSHVWKGPTIFIQAGKQS